MYYGSNDSAWMVFGSSHFSYQEGQKGLWLLQLDPRNGMPFNSSVKAKDTPGNFSVVPTLLHSGRENATVSAPSVFRLARPKLWYVDQRERERERVCVCA